ncbi:hypothetical protein O3P69_018666 [Scylla paramamosain]|uniref:Uncharacterized protein n=1 Tax=Scylla paramamosain TaxID=85552 RepID=A0AAW0SH40_SCYPA
MYRGGGWLVLSTLGMERRVGDCDRGPEVSCAEHYTAMLCYQDSALGQQQLDEQARYAKMERRRQEKVTLGDSLGRSSSRRCGARLEKGERQAKSLIKGFPVHTYIHKNIRT